MTEDDDRQCSMLSCDLCKGLKFTVIQLASFSLLFRGIFQPSEICGHDGGFEKVGFLEKWPRAECQAQKGCVAFLLKLWPARCMAFLTLSSALHSASPLHSKKHQNI